MIFFIVIAQKIPPLPGWERIEERGNQLNCSPPPSPIEGRGDLVVFPLFVGDESVMENLF